MSPGVATGGFSTKQLRQSGADVVFEDAGIGTRFSGWVARSVGAREVPHAVIPLKL
jgi:hypothetical protein